MAEKVPTRPGVQLAVPRGTPRDVARRFRVLCRSVREGQWNELDTAQILKLAALELQALPTIKAGGPTMIEDLDRLSVATARLRRTLGISSTTTTTQQQQATTREHAEVRKDAPPGQPSEEWIRDRWRSEKLQ